MNIKIATSVICLSVFFSSFSMAQNDVVDVITLKDGRGIIKGMIVEQVPGVAFSIKPVWAELKIGIDSISGVPQRRIRITDTGKISQYVVHLKSGNFVQGIINKQAPGKWIMIETDSLSVLSYPLGDIEKLERETVGTRSDIFKACGYLDVLYLRNGEKKEGVIIEQLLGKSITIKTQNGEVDVFDIGDVVKTTKEPIDKSGDIFKESSFIDQIVKNDGSIINGIIVEQIPGENLKIKTLGNSTFIVNPFEIAKFGRQENPYKEIISQEHQAEEPEYVGGCFLVGKMDSIIGLEKRQFMPAKFDHDLLLIDGGDKSTTRISQDEEVTLIVRAKDNNISPIGQVYIFGLEHSRSTKKRCIDSRKYSFLGKDSNFPKVADLVAYEEHKVGDSSFQIKFKISDPGEYAVYVEGSGKSFSLFGVDTSKKELK